MKIAIGCDEAGFELKEAIKSELQSKGMAVVDYGVGSGEKILYPDIAYRVATEVANDNHNRAILICGTGIGVCIAANKVKGIRAAVIHDTYSAERAQKSNDAQIACIGARVVGIELAKKLVSAYLSSEFLGGASNDKVARISELEG